MIFSEKKVILQPLIASMYNKKTYLIAIDKFKGSISAKGAAECLSKGLMIASPMSQSIIHPISDGGEGTLDILAFHLGLDIHEVMVADPLNRPISVKYGTKDQVAYIESSLACGLPLLTNEERNPFNTTTFGVGELIYDAMHKGCKQIHIFLGGSATNDGGTGMAAALGFKFLDEIGQEFLPTGRSLFKISSIKFPNNYSELTNVDMMAWTDVDVPLFGPNGPALMFSIQKGATKEGAILLEDGMKHYHKILCEAFGLEGGDLISGSGAAGGMGIGCLTFLKAKVGSGFEFITQATQLFDKAQQAHVIITGEGQLDDQSVKGKVVYGISKLAKSLHLPCVIVVGSNNISKENLDLLASSKVYVLAEKSKNIDEAIRHPCKYLKKIGIEIGCMTSY